MLSRFGSIAGVDGLSADCTGVEIREFLKDTHEEGQLAYTSLYCSLYTLPKFFHEIKITNGKSVRSARKVMEMRGRMEMSGRVELCTAKYKIIQDTLGGLVKAPAKTGNIQR